MAFGAVSLESLTGTVYNSNMTAIKTDVARLREILAYAPETGELRWRKTLGSRAIEGGIAGTAARQGHLVVRVAGKLMMAHQIAWVLQYGLMPAGIIRHRNGNRSDNRLPNLYESSRAEIGATVKAAPVLANNVHDIFEYLDGLLIWRTSLCSAHRVAGSVAGSKNAHGYIVVEVAGKAHLAHRLIWLMHHGSWPVGEIDHKNGVRHDNRIENLRDVVHITNTENRRAAKQGTKTGVLGVSLHTNGQYRARIRTDGRLLSLGLFDRVEDAHAAYVTAKRRLHEGCTI